LRLVTHGGNGLWCSYPKLLPMSSIGKAFERLFELADDLQLDNPDAFKLIAQFLGRAVVDEVRLATLVTSLCVTASHVVMCHCVFASGPPSFLPLGPHGRGLGW